MVFAESGRASVVGVSRAAGAMSWRGPALHLPVRPCLQRARRARAGAAAAAAGADRHTQAGGGCAPTTPAATVAAPPRARVAARSALLAWLLSSESLQHTCAHTDSHHHHHHHHHPYPSTHTRRTQTRPTHAPLPPPPHLARARACRRRHRQRSLLKGPASLCAVCLTRRPRNHSSPGRR